MKNYAILIFCLFCFSGYSQTNGWFQISKPEKVNEIIKDSQGNYHCATDMGYVKLNSQLKVTDFRNLSSHEIPVGNCLSVAVDPNDPSVIAYLEVGRVTIVKGDSTTVYSIGNNTIVSFPLPQIYWSKSGVLYVFDKRNNYVQTIEGKVVSIVEDVGFKPQSIVENNDGTKVYFGGWNNGLWVLDKATETFANFTMQNSELSTNSINDLFIDENDVLYIASYTGITSLINGTFTKYQHESLFYPCFQIDVHPGNGEVLVRTTEPNSSAQLGFCRVNLSNNTWENYREDDENCINKNTFTSVIYSHDGSKVLAFEYKAGFSHPKHQEFDYENNTCQEIDLNYSNAPEIDANTDFNVRAGKAAKTVDIGLTNLDGFNILNIPYDFNPNFVNRTLPIPSHGINYSFDVMSHKDNFLVTNTQNELQFVDIDNAVTRHENFNAGSLVKAKKAGYSKTNQVPIIYCDRIDNEMRLFLTEVDVSNKSWSEPTEIFTENREMPSWVNFSCQETSDSELICGIVKTNANKVVAAEVAKINRSTKEITQVLDKDVSEFISYVNRDLMFLGGIAHFVGNNTEELIKLEKERNRIFKNAFSKDSNGKPIYRSTYENHGKTTFSDEIYDDASTFLKALVIHFEFIDYVTVEDFSKDKSRRLLKAFGYRESYFEEKTEKILYEDELPGIDIPDSEFKDLPSDFRITQNVNFANEKGKYSTFMLTNYGLVFKQGIEYESALGTFNRSIAESKISVYPNPASEAISIKGVAIKQLVLFDIKGRKISNSSTSYIDVSTLSKGLYFLEITTANNQKNIRRVAIQ